MLVGLPTRQGWVAPMGAEDLSGSGAFGPRLYFNQYDPTIVLIQMRSFFSGHFLFPVSGSHKADLWFGCSIMDAVGTGLGPLIYGWVDTTNH